MGPVEDIEALFSEDAKRARTALAYAMVLETRVDELTEEVAELRSLIEKR